jgi:hypothetical protein
VARGGTATLVVAADGRWDLDRLRASAPYLVAARTATERIRTRIGELRTGDLLPPLATAARELIDAIDELGELTATAARTAVLLPAMLGADGARTHLVLLQNPAELRATGGVPAAFVIVRAEGGRLRLLRHGTSADLGAFPQPVLPLADWQRDLYTDRPGRSPADVNLGPHFPTAAELLREMYRRHTGETVDSVIAIDPVALSYLLPAAGSLPMPTGPALTADNAVQLLLSHAYTTAAKPGDGDAYSAAAAKAAFEALNRGAQQAQPALAGLALTGLARAASERRLLMWSARAQEQEAIAGSVLEGAMPAEDGDRPAVGVFLNDAGGAKLDYYLVPSAQLDVSGCGRGGRLRLHLQVVLHSTAPRTGLPAHVLAQRLPDDPYTARTQMLIFSPTGGSIINAQLSGLNTPLRTGTERGRAVGVFMIDLPPGGTRTLEVDLLTKPLTNVADRVTPELWLTPGVNPWARRISPGAGCPA